MSLRVLQFSDLHIGCELLDISSFVANVEMAVRDEQNNIGVIDAIVVTGDIFDGSSFSKSNYKDSIKVAVDLFNSLIFELNKKTGSSLVTEDVFFVPGNHEINRENIINKKSGFDKYEEFLEIFYQEKPEFYCKKHKSIFKKFDDEKIILVGFNSAMYECSESDEAEDKDYGYISPSQLSDMTFKIDQLPNKSEFKIVAFLHHHFYLIEERHKEYYDSSTLKNHSQFLSYLNKYDLGLIMHGHKHESTNRRLVINSNLSEPDKLVNVIGCGASNKKDTSYNSFNFIEIFSPDDSLELKMIEFVYRSSKFEPQDSIQLPIEGKRKSKIKIIDEFKKTGKLEKIYQDFKSTDTSTPADELILTLDKTVGSLTGTASVIETNPKLVFCLLFPMHYRYGLHCDDQFLFNLKELIESELVFAFSSEKKKKILFELLKKKSIYEVNKLYDELKDISSDIEKTCLYFIMISIFLTDFHIVLRSKAEEFYKSNIEKKSNLILEPGSINQDIHGTKIAFEVDEERRAIAVSVQCKSGNAHKLVTLITKEFDILISKYEDDFTKVGFKIYYVVPKINKLIDNGVVKLESYNFEAYIPTLIPLLAGENLYSQPEAFARELIQNSIDAINVRLGKNTEEDYSGIINIEIGRENDSNYFIIEDNGTGMNKYVLERYFTSIGRSFYKSDDFTELGINYKPISMFGIGFLSCFVIGKRVDVKTKYYLKDESESNSYRLEIPNFDGCFFIENSQMSHCGTVIKIYEDTEKNNFDYKKIISYIKSNIQAIPIDITICNKIDNKSSKIMRFEKIDYIVNETKRNRFLFVIPLSGDAQYEVINIEKYYNDKKYRHQYTTCIFIYKRDDALLFDQEITADNSGVKIKNIYEMSEFLMSNFGDFFDVYVNFPSEMIELDVSRDSLLKHYINQEKVRKAYTQYLKKFSCRTDLQKYPYYILRKISPEKFNVLKLQLYLENDKLFLKYFPNTSNLNEYKDSLIYWFNLIEPRDDKYKNTFDGIKSKKSDHEVKDYLSNLYQDVSKVIEDIFSIYENNSKLRNKSFNIFTDENKLTYITKSSEMALKRDYRKMETETSLLFYDFSYKSHSEHRKKRRSENKQFNLMFNVGFDIFADILDIFIETLESDDADLEKFKRRIEETFIYFTEKNRNYDKHQALSMNDVSNSTMECKVERITAYYYYILFDCRLDTGYNKEHLEDTFYKIFINIMANNVMLKWLAMRLFTLDELQTGLSLDFEVYNKFFKKGTLFGEEGIN